MPLRALLLAAAGSFALERLASLRPDLIERWYASAFGPRLIGGLSFVSGILPFSLAEGVLLGGVVALLWGLLRALRAQDPLRELGRLGRILLWVGGVAVLTFPLLFGLGYDRPPLETRLGWEAGEVDARKVVYLAEAVVDLANKERERVTPSRPPLDASLDAGYRRASTALSLTLPEPRAPAKPILLSEVLSRVGIAGFFFPWTGEVNYDFLVPWNERPHTIAHEKAHQRGIAREDEANFLGMLACLLAPDPLVRYSGELFAENDLLRELRSRDPDAFQALLKRRSSLVVADVEAERDYWKRHEGWAMNVGQGVNDRYLRSQGVREGARSYGLSARLLLRFAVTRPGAELLSP